MAKSPTKAAPAPAPVSDPVDESQVADATTGADGTDAAAGEEPSLDEPADADAPTESVDGEEPETGEPTTEELNAATIVPMAHADGGTCDRYEQDEDGNILVPVEEISLMVEHGFAVVYAKEA
jgi:hypothetical protein